MVVTFDQPVQCVGGCDPADVTLSSGTVDQVENTGSGDGLTIDLHGTTNAEPLTVGFPGIAHANDVTKVVTDTLCFGVLAGDVTGDGQV